MIKATGGTRGIGTIEIVSWQNLISTVGYLMTTGDKFILRQFIKAKSGCRMIVLDKEVIAAADFAMNENDFEMLLFFPKQNISKENIRTN